MQITPATPPHRKRLMAISIALCALLLAGTPTGAQAQQSQRESQQRLTQLRAQIGHLSEELNDRRGDRSAAQQQLAVVERDLSQKSSRLRKVRSELKETSRSLKTLETRRHSNEQLLVKQREALRSNLQSAWRAGRNQELKLLLNQDSSAEFGRMLTYYRYLNAARSKQIGRYRAQLASYTRVQQELADVQQSLGSQLALAEQLVAELEADRESREVAIAEIDQELRRQGGQLSNLQTEENQLTQLLDRLQRALRSVPARTTPPVAPPTSRGERVVIPANRGSIVTPTLASGGSRRAFRGLRGELPWPSEGQLQKPRFARLKGVLIAADRGATVRAVAHGEVIFADWLQHFGMLVVVDHDNGYMSLYGHNEALLVNVGDSVEPGSALARVGDTGGREQAALYFELRHNRQNLSPQRWLARRG